ncbi:MAG: Mucin-2 [Candidatus Magasanikbacteria bacterium GW2011_GWC2_37_14]|uniref:Mucin-2 n=1 Tax=Candidatus Magasanikbacteria bacterium GW2011_GWC2_37_14 TaxID=1619046 RepID=A0A0G0GP26_9BACT|nr:MAG: Mucin-2 [Candidatus Magasanikbacteria bacterium GW2011_GWC2_37_14]
MPERRKKIWGWGFLFGLVFILILFIYLSEDSYTYDTKVAHPGIVDAAVKLYNEKNPDKKITVQQTIWLREGAMDEDTPTRWLNHFYDPVYNRGIWFTDQQLSAKAWYDSSFTQKMFALGDFSWSRALNDYVNNDQKMAFIGLGHTLHLLADMTVPAHTRDDIHVIPGDSYEQYLKSNWKNIPKGEYVEITDLDSAFDELAGFTNNNFYSDDTIVNEKYIFPKFDVKEKVGDYLIKNLGGKKYKLLYKKQTAFEGIEDIYVFKFNDLVRYDYSQLLLPKAIGYSVGAIKLFFDEAEKYQGEITESRINSLGYTDYLLGKGISFLGELKDYFKTKTGDNTVITETPPEIKTTTENTPKTETKPAVPVVVAPIVKPIVTLPVEPKNEPQSPIIPVLDIPAPETEIPLPEPVSTTPPVVYPGNGGHDGGSSDNISGNTCTDALLCVSTPTSTIPDPIVPTTTPTSTILDPIVPTSTCTDATSCVSTTTPPIDPPPTSTPTSTPPDTTPPELPIINITQTNFVTPTLQITWESVGAIAFALEYRVGDSENLSGIEYLNLTTSTTSTVWEFVGEKLKVYQFRVQAVDEVGNATDWVESDTVIPDWPKTIIINEIAWMGTGPTPDQKNDEWLELYNNTEAEIDLSTWQILINSQPLTWNKINTKISAGGYYLLERTDDSSVVNIPADGFFTISGGLNNSGANLKLVNNGQTIDEINCVSGWYAGLIANNKYRSMQRIFANQPGSMVNNWQTALGAAPKAKVSGGEVIYGSPKLSNQGYWLLYGDLSNYYNQAITSNVLHLTKDNSPYFIGYQVTIPSTLKVEIDPGVILVGFDRSSFIDVSGELNLLGTETEPVIITSALDSNYFNQNYLAFTNLTAGEPAPGDWSRIQVKQAGKFTANYTNFFYGGARFLKNNGWVYGDFVAQVIRNLGGTVEINNTTFNNNYLETRSAELGSNAILWNEAPPAGTANLKVENSRFNGGNLAIKNTSEVESIISNNYFTEFQSANGPIDTSFLKTSLENNELVNNLLDRVEFGQLILNRDVTLTGDNNYSFSTINVPSDYTLTIEPGVNLYLIGDFVVNGNLEAQGTSEAPINILPKNEHWGVLSLNNANTNLAYTNLELGNHSSVSSVFTRGMITANNSNLTLENVNLKNSERPANMIYAKNSALQIDNSRLEWIEEWNDPGDWIIAGIIVDGGSLALTNSYLDNMDYGVEFLGGATFDPLNLFTNTFSRITLGNWWPLIPN